MPTALAFGSRLPRWEILPWTVRTQVFGFGQFKQLRASGSFSHFGLVSLVSVKRVSEEDQHKLGILYKVS